MLDISKAANFLSQSRKTESSMLSPSASVSLKSPDRGRRFEVSGSIGRKRLSSSISASIPAGKRIYSTSPTKKTISPTLLNRVHRRVIVSDYGKPIYRANSCAAMLAALEGCIKGKRYYSGLHSVANKDRLQISISDRDPSTRYIGRQSDDERRPCQSILASVSD